LAHSGVSTSSSFGGLHVRQRLLMADRSASWLSAICWSMAGRNASTTNGSAMTNPRSTEISSLGRNTRAFLRAAPCMLAMSQLSIITMNRPQNAAMASAPSQARGPVNRRVVTTNMDSALKIAVNRTMAPSFV
jgi:hypothetical protein